MASDVITQENTKNANAAISSSLGTGTITASDLTTATSKIQNSLQAATTESTTNAATISIASNIQSLFSTTSSVNSLYEDGGARLVNFTYQDGSDDDNRRAYMKLGGNYTGLMAAISGVNQTALQAIYSELISKYSAFILLRADINYQEKQNIMATIGDSFASTFAGAEPQVLSISGFLPFYGESSSWFLAFLQAFRRFIRASMLAQYRCWLEITLPDLMKFRCYPVNFSATLSSDSDTLVPFTLGAVVVENPILKGGGYTSSVTASKSTTETSATENSATAASNAQQTQQTNTTAEVGQKAQRQTFADTLKSTVKNVETAINKTGIKQTLTVSNQILGAVSIFTGKSYGSALSRGKSGRARYD